MFLLPPINDDDALPAYAFVIVTIRSTLFVCNPVIIFIFICVFFVVVFCFISHFQLSITLKMRKERTLNAVFMTVTNIFRKSGKKKSGEKTFKNTNQKRNNNGKKTTNSFLLWGEKVCNNNDNADDDDDDDVQINIRSRNAHKISFHHLECQTHQHPAKSNDDRNADDGDK